jgi:plasmid segregation protein ParM
MHTPNEKEGIKQRLTGTHTITINGETKTFSIENVIVVPETVIAFWIQRRSGITHYVDLGSRTINYGTVYNDNQEMRFIDSQSGTFEHKGLDVLNDLEDYQSLVDYVAGRLLAKWDENEQVYLIGGGAKNQNIFRMFKEYFPNCAVHKNPQMASVEGMYAFGRYVYDAVLH